MSEGVSLIAFVDPDLAEKISQRIESIPGVFKVKYQTYQSNPIDLAKTESSIRSRINAFNKRISGASTNSEIRNSIERIKPQYTATALAIYRTYIKAIGGTVATNIAVVGQPVIKKIDGENTECPQLYYNAQMLSRYQDYLTRGRTIDRHITRLEQADILWHTNLPTKLILKRGSYDSVFTLNPKCIHQRE